MRGRGRKGGEEQECRRSTSGFWPSYTCSFPVLCPGGSSSYLRKKELFWLCAGLCRQVRWWSCVFAASEQKVGCVPNRVLWASNALTITHITGHPSDHFFMLALNEALATVGSIFYRNGVWKNPHPASQQAKECELSHLREP